MRPIPQAQCLVLIHEFEKGPDGGFAASPYQDPAGLWTNGWGHRCAQDAKPITAAQADAQVIDDLRLAAIGVSDAVDLVLESLTDNQYAAMVDLAFNIGVQAFANSTLAHFVNVGAMHLVPYQFLRWNKGHVGGAIQELPGLTRRRQAEVKLYLASDPS